MRVFVEPQIDILRLEEVDIMTASTDELRWLEEDQ